MKVTLEQRQLMLGKLVVVLDSKLRIYGERKMLTDFVVSRCKCYGCGTWRVTYDEMSDRNLAELTCIPRRLEDLGCLVGNHG